MSEWWTYFGGSWAILFYSALCSFPQSLWLLKCSIVMNTMMEIPMIQNGVIRMWHSTSYRMLLSECHCSRVHDHRNLDSFIRSRFASTPQSNEKESTLRCPQCGWSRCRLSIYSSYHGNRYHIILASSCSNDQVRTVPVSVGIHAVESAVCR